MTKITYQPKVVEYYLQGLAQQRELISRYIKYWDSITPRDSYQYYCRWLFAFMSVHTRWQANVNGYLALDKLLGPDSESAMNVIFNDNGLIVDTSLYKTLKECRAGLHNQRFVGIERFHFDFYGYSEEWYQQENETIRQLRDRLEPNIYGLGLAKTAFALEMCYPRNYDVVCLDTHLIKFYQVAKNGKPLKGLTDELYRQIEDHWCSTCKGLEIPSGIARHIWWDQKQGYEDCRYWSWCLEKQNVSTRDNGIGFDNAGTGEG